MAKTTTTEPDNKNPATTEPTPEDRNRSETFKMLGMVFDGFGDDADPVPPDEDENKDEKPEGGDDTNPPPSDPPEPESKDEDEEDEETPPKPDPVAKKPKVEVRKKDVPLPDIPPFEPEKPATRSPEERKPEPTKKIDSPDDLSDEEREDLELAQWAEKETPGLADKVSRFIKERRDFIAQKVKDEGRAYRPSGDPEFREWMEDNYPFRQSQKKQLERKKLQEELRTEIEQGNRKREDELRQEIDALKLKPEIEKRRMKFREDVEKVIPEALQEIFPELKDKTDDAVTELRPLVDPVIDRYTGMAETFLSLNAGATRYDSGNNTHAYINSFIDQQARHFEANGGVNLFRDGKRFVRPDVMPQIPREKAHLYWTFSERDIVDVLAEKAGMESRQILKNERQKWEKFQKLYPAKQGKKSKLPPDDNKAGPQGGDLPDETPDEDLGPKAGTSPSPGAGGGGGNDPDTPSLMGFLNEHGR